MASFNAFFLLFLLQLGTSLGVRKLLLIGGGLKDDNVEIYGKMLEISGGAGKSRIGIVTAASEDPQGSADFYLEHFSALGAQVFWIPVHLDNLGAASDPDVVQEVAGLTGVFFGGGDQSRIIQALYENGRTETPVLTQMRNRFESGDLAVGGTSAGAACMSGGVMVTGGLSYEALLYGATTDDAHPDDLQYDPEGGLGFLPGLVIDTHFSERGREGRLIRLLSDTKNQKIGSTFGFGVDEDTALLVTSDNDGNNVVGDVIGTSGVFFADLKNAKENNDEYWEIQSVYAHYLKAGDKFSLSSQTVLSYVDWKTDMNGQEYFDEAKTSSDIFNGNRDRPDELPEFEFIATRLFDTKDFVTTGVTYERNPEFEVVFTKGSYSVAFGGHIPGVEPPMFDISYQDLVIDIFPCRSTC